MTAGQSRPPAGTPVSTPVSRVAARLAVTALAAVALLAGCASGPDRTLHPQPPAVRYAPLQHPFHGARLLADPDTAAGRWSRAHAARWLDPVTSRPQARWLTGPQDLAGVPALARRAAAQRALPVLVAYWIPNRGCAGFAEGAPQAADYRRWVDRLVAGLAGTRAAVIMEPDAVAADCFDPARARLLRQAVHRLAAAGQYVYLDAGHAGWRSTGEMAERLLAAGIQDAQGFAVNASNRQRTDTSYRWARELSDLVGNREFVIDTSRNGLGPPPDDPRRDDEWCNPARQALGHPPTTAVTAPGLAALLWIKLPGESDGPCGGETGYAFSPVQARRLIANSPWVPAGERALAARSRTPAAGA